MTATFGAKAWLAWTVACGVLITSVRNPVVDVMAVGALAVVSASLSSRMSQGRSFGFFLKLGVIFMLFRVVLFGATGHTGATTLAELPALSLPVWLGGLQIGGRITGEVVAQSAAEGLRIVAILACFGVFLAVVETYRVLRMLPAFMFEAGVVVAIALAFVPSLLRTATDIRDAQRLRGHRFRGIRSWVPLVVPLLGTSLERAMTLAASMESRGYGRAPHDAGQTEARARLAILSGLIVIAGAGGVFVLQGGFLAAIVTAGGFLLALAGLARLSRAVSRTRFRAERAGAWDRVLVGIAFAAVPVALLLRSVDAARWSPYPVLNVPAVDARLLLVPLVCLAPLLLHRAQAARLRRASAHHPYEQARAGA